MTWRREKYRSYRGSNSDSSAARSVANGCTGYPFSFALFGISDNFKSSEWNIRKLNYEINAGNQNWMLICPAVQMRKDGLLQNAS
jgi:hypothetical protein